MLDTTDKGEQISEEQWLAVAKDILIRQGVSHVNITTISKELGVTRGGFYWRFKDRKDLLDRLIDDWYETNTRSLVRALQRAGKPKERFRRVARIFSGEGDFNTALDVAIRNWGSTDERIAALVREQDRIRCEALMRHFIDSGTPETEAYVRSKVFYFFYLGCLSIPDVDLARPRGDIFEMYMTVLSGM